MRAPVTSITQPSHLGRIILALILVSAVSGCGRRADAPTTASTRVFDGARLIVGDGRPAIENAVLIVEDGRIVRVGRADEVPIPEGATRVDVRGKTIMPAIVDAHTHLSQTREALTTDLRRRAYYGIGAALSLGLDDGPAPFLIRNETIPGAARFLTAGRGITAPEPGRTEVPYWITSEAEARQAVQELSAARVSIVKIWVDDRDGMYTKLSPALYGAVIDEAHMRGLRVTAHIFTLEDAKGLLRAGIDAFAHGIRDRDVDDEVLALFKAHPEVVVVPNLPDRGVAADMGWLRGGVTAEELETARSGATDRPAAQAAFGIQARNLAALNAAGVRIAFGTDGNTPWAPHVEMADMVAAGMTPAQVITAATKTSAEFLTLPDTGTVEAGKSADFVVLDANPLDDITNTRRIASVYLHGSMVDRTIGASTAPTTSTR